MSFLPRLRVEQSVSPRQPAEDSLLVTVQKELWPLFIELRKVLNWAATYVGLVQVDASQEAVTLEEAAVAGTGVTITKIGTTPNKQLQFAANASEITNIVNVTNITESSTTGSTLFPCDIPDPLLRPDCTGYIAFGEGYGWGGWSAIDGLSTWQYDTLGTLNRYVNTGDVPVVAGERLFADSAGLATTHDGPYEVVNPGDGASYPVIRRVPDANTPTGLCHNMAVRVLDIGDGTSKYRTLSTADPIVVDTTALTFATNSTRTSTAAQHLLTPPQVGTSGADSDTLVMVTTADAGGANDVSMFPDKTFVTLAGTPGSATIPKGKWQAIARLGAGSGFNPATPPRVDFKFRVVHADMTTEADFLTISSPPISVATNSIYSAEAVLAADVTISPTDMTEMRAYAHSSGGAVNVVLIWQNAARDTRFITTLAMGGFGSGVHDDLSGRDNPNAHAFVCSVTEAGGLIPTVTAPTVVVTPSSSGATMSGISTAGLTTGVKLNLIFQLPCVIANQATEACPAGYAPFYTFNMMGTPQSPSIEQALGRVEVQYLATELSLSPCFVILAGPLS